MTFSNRIHPSESHNYKYNINDAPYVQHAVEIQRLSNKNSLYDAALTQLMQIDRLHAHFKSKKATTWHIERSIQNMTSSVESYRGRVESINTIGRCDDFAGSLQVLIQTTLGLSDLDMYNSPSVRVHTLGGLLELANRIEEKARIFKVYLIKTEKHQASCKCGVM